MPEIRYIVEPEFDGTRLDVYLSLVGSHSRSTAARLITDNNVRAGGAVARKNHRVTRGEEILLTEPEPVPPEALPEDIPLDIVFEDRDIIVINKPSGICVHPSPGHETGTLVNALLAHCEGELSGIGGVRRPGIVHRLDKDTSGLMVAAKNDMAHTTLAEALKKRDISRIYEALARGNLKEDQFTVNAPIGRHKLDRKRQAIVPDGREAVTHFEVIGRYTGYCHLRCELETGRTHQIRVHLSSIGHPVAGDIVYGGKKSELGLDNQCLHAKRLSFTHPRTGEGLSFETELPESFNNALTILNKLD